MQLRHGLAKSLRTHEVLAKFKTQLQIGRITFQPLFHFFDQYSGSLFLRGLKLFGFLRVRRVFFPMFGKKFLMRGDLALCAAHF